MSRDQEWEDAPIGSSRVTDLPTGRSWAAFIGALGGQMLAVRLAARAQEALLYGRAVGLGDAECREVVKAWSDHHAARLTALRWPDVEAAMVRRAMGEDWRP